ncbi:MAG: hypothetical protein M0P33_00205 [Massilibacteroides sp.]|nr:hypothetical protein [Massilibacteroides sp.]
MADEKVSTTVDEESFIDKILADASEFARSEDEKEEKELTVQEQIEEAKSAYRILNSEQYKFKPGDIIQFKPGMKNTYRPAYGQPVIVSRVLETPFIQMDNNDTGTPYFNTPVDIVVLMLSRDGEGWLEFHQDSRRYMPFEG